MPLLIAAYKVARWCSGRLAAIGAASLAAAGPAGAAIVFEKSPFRPTVWSAADDGSARVQLT